jgi:hypothetical protein
MRRGDRAEEVFEGLMQQAHIDAEKVEFFNLLVYCINLNTWPSLGWKASCKEVPTIQPEVEGDEEGYGDLHQQDPQQSQETTKVSPLSTGRAQQAQLS